MRADVFGSAGGLTMSRPASPVPGFDYATGREVSMTPAEWQQKYPPAEFRREVSGGETFYRSRRRMERGEWINAEIVAEAYANIPEVA